MTRKGGAPPPFAKNNPHWRHFFFFFFVFFSFYFRGMSEKINGKKWAAEGGWVGRWRGKRSKGQHRQLHFKFN